MLKYNGNILKWNGKWGNASTAPSTVYTVTCSGTNGTVSAVPSAGITGTEVTLYNEPAQGYEFDSYTVSGATLKNDNQFDIADSNVTVVGNFTESFVLYDYMTFKCGTSYSGSFDQAFGCAKKYPNSYMKNLDNNTTASIDGRDAMLWNVTAGTTYMCYWAEADITTTKNYSTASWSSYPVVSSGNGGAAAIGELYSMDFWHKPNWSSWNMYNCTLIPQDYRNIHRGEELTNCSNLFKNAPITNSIKKFILAMQIACPNLTTTTGCFSGCTTAPDYAEALAQYPGWF